MVSLLGVRVRGGFLACDILDLDSLLRDLQVSARISNEAAVVQSLLYLARECFN